MGSLRIHFQSLAQSGMITEKTHIYTGEAHRGGTQDISVIPAFPRMATGSFFNSRAHPSVLEVEAVNAPGHGAK